MTLRALDPVTRPAAALGLILIFGCQPMPTAKAKGKMAPVETVMPKWRYAYTDNDTATFASTDVQTVGAYKRLWLSNAYAMPKKVTLRGSTGLATGLDDLVELDCTQTRLRVIETSARDDKDWYVFETREQPVWYYLHPDAHIMDTVRDVCAGKSLTGTGYPTMKAARLAFRASVASKAAEVAN